MLGPCKHCHQEMRPQRVKEHEAPGTVGYGADGGCRSCRRRLGLKREVPENCVECDHRMRPAGARAKDHPGTRLHKGKGVCDTCVKRDRPSRAQPKVEVIDEDTVVLTDPDPEDVASLAAWERHRAERKRRQEKAQRIRVEQEAVQRRFIASRRAAA